MIFYSFYWAKTAFVSLLMISITFEATCSGPVSELFNSLIVGIISANEGEHSAASISNQRPLELKLADAQMLQQWIGQIARKIVVEDGIFAGNYLCCPNININAVILTDGLPKERIKKIVDKKLKEVHNLEQKGQFLKLLFSFGAMLSAEIGEQSQQNGTLRALLKAYECVGEQFNGISNFVIQAVIKRSYDELKVDKIILESQSIDKLNHRLIQEFTLLNALNIQMTPKDIINFASFIYGNFLNYPTNPFEKSFLKDNGLSVYTLDKDPVKSRRIALKLLIHLKNWGLNELEEFSKEYFKDVIKLTRRDKCIFGIFTQNLLQRMAKFELLDDYFGELNIGDLVNYAKDQMKYFERLSAENCYENRRKEWGEGNESKQQNKPKKENEGIENSKIYPFLDEAIRIDWNVWKEIIQQIDQLSETIKCKDKKQKKLEEYSESVEFKDAMKIIRVKFDKKKFGLELKAEGKKKWELDFFTSSKETKFCSNLAEIRQICEENIKQYEREMHVIIKQKENHKKFYDFMANFVEHFGKNSIKNDNGKSIEFDLNWAKSFLEKLYNSATNQIVKKNKSKEFKCLPNKKLNFETAIKAILDQNLNEKAKNLLKEFYVPPKNAEGGLKHFLEVNVEAQLFELFYSFAARLEAIVHGKNIDGTIKKSPENSKDKIRAFLAVPNCFNVPEWPNKFSIFDYWMEIKEINPKKSQIPVIGVAIPIFWKIDENEEAKSISRESYKTLKALNEQKFSFYETTKLLRQIYDRIDGHRSSLIYMIIPEIITKPLNQISSENAFKWKNNNYVYSHYGSHIRGCEFVKLFQNVSANFLKMEDVTLDTEDSNLQDYVKRDFGKFCKILERIDSRVEEAKIAFLNNVRYDLVIDFTSNAWKYGRDITKDLLGKWTREKLTKETTFAEGNEKYMLEQIKEFTSYQINRERISKIEALKAKEKDGYDLLGLFDRLDELVRKIMDEEMPNLEKAKKELINVKGKKQKKEIEEEIKRIMKLVESVREMGKRLGQMLEDVKKHYGQKMDE